MTFADFLIAVPAGYRLLLAVAITVAITVLCVWRFHRQILTVAGWPAPSYDDPIAQQQPRINDLVVRVLGLTATAFVFLLAFTLSNLWSGVQAGREATQNESANYDRALVWAERIPPGQGREDILRGLAEYRDDVLSLVLPALQQADLERAAAAQRAADVRLQTAAATAYGTGVAESPLTSELSTILTDLVSYGEDRVNALPAGDTVRGGLLLVFALGLANLALTAIYVPAPMKPNLVLIGLLAAITAMMLFVVVEAANPYIGGAAVSSVLPLPTG